MDRLKEQLAIAAKALASFRRLAELPSRTEEQRDAAIKRFEYTLETIWKAAQRYLLDRESREEGSPRGCIRACREVGILSAGQAEQALKMADDRNLTSHTYNEDLAHEVEGRLKDHAEICALWLAGMEARSKAS